MASPMVTTQAAMYPTKVPTEVGVPVAAAFVMVAALVDEGTKAATYMLSSAINNAARGNNTNAFTNNGAVRLSSSSNFWRMALRARVSTEYTLPTEQFIKSAICCASMST